MATRYFVLTDVAIGRTYNWNTIRNWSTASGGAGGASIPTENDDVIIDAGSVDHGFPLNQQCRINGANMKCRNLTIRTGFGWAVIINEFCSLRVYGELNLQGDATLPVHIFYDPTAAVAYPSYRNFLLFGTLGEVTYCNAEHLSCVGGKRIYYNQDTCVVSNCPFWLEYNVILNDAGLEEIVKGPITRYIYTPGQLQAVSDRPDDIYILKNSIDMSDYPFVPLCVELGKDFGGSAGNHVLENPFTGSFDGQNHTISNLEYDDTSPALGYAALFAGVGSSFNPNGAFITPVIENLKISNLNFTASGSVAGLISYMNSGAISNITVANVNLNNTTGTGFSFGGLVGGATGWTNQASSITGIRITNVVITGTDDFNGAGGMAGFITVQDTSAEFTITNCRVNNFVIISTGNFISNAGGLIGQGGGIISSCRVKGTISQANDSVGGFIGYAYPAVVTNSRAEVIFLDVPDNSSDIGGFVGYSDLGSSYYNCRSKITLSSSANELDSIGGFIGEVRYPDAIYKSFSIGTILLTGTNGSFDNAIGGFVGYLDNFNVHDCYSRVSVSAVNYAQVGGFAGYISGGNTPQGLVDCYSSGAVIGNTKVGGFIGTNAGDGIAVLNCYSVGAVTGSTKKGGFIGEFDTSGSKIIDLANCAWYTASSTNAIGDNGSGSVIATLASGGYGTDTSDNTLFYSKDHPVYAQV